MKKQRKHHTPEEEVAILRRHLLEKEPISVMASAGELLHQSEAWHDSQAAPRWTQSRRGFQLVGGIENDGGPDRARICDLYRVKVAVAAQLVDSIECLRRFQGPETGVGPLNAAKTQCETECLADRSSQ